MITQKQEAMATVSGNILTSGIRGKIGDMLVFRQIGGKTFVSRAPRKPDKRKESAAQRHTRTTFKDASRWAKNVIRDPEKKAYYKKRAQEWKLTNAYTAAVKDYMRNAHANAKNEITELKPRVVVESLCFNKLIACKLSLDTTSRFPDFDFARLNVGKMIEKIPRQGHWKTDYALHRTWGMG